MQDRDININHNIVNLLFISGEGITHKKLCDLFNIAATDLNKIIKELKILLNDVGLDLMDHEEKHGSKKLSIITGKGSNEVLSEFFEKEKDEALTPAQLQTLTLIAYLEEATNSEVSFIRGVQSSQTLRTMCVRGFIVKNGDHYKLSTDSLMQLGITSNIELKDFETISANLKNKLKDALNA